MKLKEYIKGLKDIEKKHPDLEVVYSIDDEGNDYSKVYFSPTLGCFKEEGYGSEFLAEGEFDDWKDEQDDLVVNAVCIN
jgi:hypothetical protein